MSSRPKLQPVTAWLWFLELPPQGRALDASGGHTGVAEQLPSHFSEVIAFTEGERGLTKGTFDCVVLHDNITGPTATPSEIVTRFEHFFGLLKTDGWLVAGSSNPMYVGRRPTPGVRVAPLKLIRWLRKAGFREVRLVHASPSLEVPATLVPDTRCTIVSYEASSLGQDSARWARYPAAMLGLGRHLYSAYFVMARR